MYTAYDRKEIDEAINAAEITLNHLNNAEGYLHSAGNFGIWDMLGGGLLATWGKHSKIDAAQEEMDLVKQSIGRLRKELSDIGYIEDISVEIDGFMRFADYWWDGFFVDWMVQDKIRDAQYKVSEAKSKVLNLLERLRSM